MLSTVCILHSNVFLRVVRREAHRTMVHWASDETIRLRLLTTRRMEFWACSGSQGVSPIRKAVTGMFEYQPIVSLPVEHTDRWVTVCIADITLPNPTNMFFVLLTHNGFVFLCWAGLSPPGGRGG
ncbi:unnamed protein product, partial [Ectocarpus sp. 4 AP-2014]